MEAGWNHTMESEVYESLAPNYIECVMTQCGCDLISRFYSNCASGTVSVLFFFWILFFLRCAGSADPPVFGAVPSSCRAVEIVSSLYKPFIIFAIFEIFHQSLPMAFLRRLLSLILIAKCVQSIRFCCFWSPLTLCDSCSLCIPPLG